MPTVIELTTPEFESAHGGLLRIKSDRGRQFFPVVRDVRVKAYAASPTFRKVENHLDGPIGMGWLQLAGDNDIPAAFYKEYNAQILPTIYTVLKKTLTFDAFNAYTDQFRNRISRDKMNLFSISSLGGVLSITAAMTLLAITSYSGITHVMHVSFPLVILFIISVLLDLMGLNTVIPTPPPDAGHASQQAPLTRRSDQPSPP